MKAAIFSFAAVVASVLAESTTSTSSAASSTSGCAADYIVEQCLTDTQTTQQNCKSTDYTCQCAAYQAELTCFNNCPDDSRRATYAGSVSEYCALASQYSTTNTPISTAASTATGTGSASAATTSTGSSTGTPTADSASSASASASASSSSSANSAAGLALNAGGVLVAVAGAMGVLM